MFFVVDDVETIDSGLVSKNMNHYFPNVGESLSRRFENEDETNEFSNNLVERFDSTFKFESINVPDLKVVLSAIRNTSPGYNEVPSEVYIEYFFCLGPLITKNVL